MRSSSCHPRVFGIPGPIHRRATRRLASRPRGAAIVRDGRHVQVLSSRSSRESRGSIVHNLPNGIRLRESASSIELLGDASDEALEQLVKVATKRFGSIRVKVLGRKDVGRRLARIALDRGLEIAQEREWLNGFAFGAAYSFHILRDREDAETGEPLKTREYLRGFLIAYDRELIPQRLAISISKPFYFNKERFDTPFDFILKGLLRKGPWEGFLGLLVTWNIRVFEGERAAKEGEKNILSLGIGGVMGGAYLFNPRWSLDLEFGYAYIPTEDIVEHEFTTALSAVYHF